MNDITVTMVTLDRSPGPNYLAQTLEDFRRSGVFISPRLRQFHIVDSGSPNPEQYLTDQIPASITHSIYREHGAKRHTRDNAATALALAADTGPKWVLYCEDDISVCDEFLDGVGAWLDDHENEDRRVYVFGAAYAQILQAHLNGGTYWDYPVRAFYGTQCWAVRRADAIDLSEWLFTHELVFGVPANNAVDMYLQEWAVNRWPRIQYFLASAPNFAQHVGFESAIGSKKFDYPAWIGPEWTYARKASVGR